MLDELGDDRRRELFAVHRIAKAEQEALKGHSGIRRLLFHGQVERKLRRRRLDKEMRAIGLVECHPSQSSIDHARIENECI